MMNTSVMQLLWKHYKQSPAGVTFGQFHTVGLYGYLDIMRDKLIIPKGNIKFLALFSMAAGRSGGFPKRSHNHKQVDQNLQ